MLQNSAFAAATVAGDENNFAAVDTEVHVLQDDLAVVSGRKPLDVDQDVGVGRAGLRFFRCRRHFVDQKARRPASQSQVKVNHAENPVGDNDQHDAADDGPCRAVAHGTGTVSRAKAPKTPDSADDQAEDQRF